MKGRVITANADGPPIKVTASFSISAPGPNRSGGGKRPKRRPRHAAVNRSETAIPGTMAARRAADRPARP